LSHDDPRCYCELWVVFFWIGTSWNISYFNYCWFENLNQCWVSRYLLSFEHTNLLKVLSIIKISQYHAGTDDTGYVGGTFILVWSKSDSSWLVSSCEEPPLNWQNVHASFLAVEWLGTYIFIQTSHSFAHASNHWTIIANYVVVLLLMMELESQVDHDDEHHITDEILSKRDFLQLEEGGGVGKNLSCWAQ
jgi:hypothetical protein